MLTIPLFLISLCFLYFAYFVYTTRKRIKAENIEMLRNIEKLSVLKSTLEIARKNKDIDVIIPVHATETHKIQECHVVIYHALCIFIENSLPKQFLI